MGRRFVDDPMLPLHRFDPPSHRKGFHRRWGGAYLPWEELGVMHNVHHYDSQPFGIALCSVAPSTWQRWLLAGRCPSTKFTAG